jgi:hypothetical protein
MDNKITVNTEHEFNVMIPLAINGYYSPSRKGEPEEIVVWAQLPDGSRFDLNERQDRKARREVRRIALDLLENSGK